MYIRFISLFVIVLFSFGCSETNANDPKRDTGTDSEVTTDTTGDSTSPDSSQDSAQDTAKDTGPLNTDEDTGAPDTGHDSAVPDTGADTVSDSGADTVPTDIIACSAGNTLTPQDIDCTDDNDIAIPGCMDFCGAAYSWQGIDCSEGLECVEGDCYDTDGPSGFCFPPSALECATSENCACLPQVCSGLIGWRCNSANKCEPVFQ